MSRKGISKLGLPKRKFDPAFSTARKDSKIRFETEEEAKAEDLVRAKSTEAEADAFFDEDEFDFLEGYHGLKDPLTRKLLQGIGGAPQPSPASKVYMRDRKRALAGHLWRLSSQHSLDERFFTLMPVCWEIPAEELVDLDVCRIKNAFRAQLLHYGSDEADGYLFAGIDGEFYEPEGVFRLHYHGLAAGGMIDVVERLRGCRKFKPTGVTKSGKRRTVLQMKKVKDQPEPYTYSMKSSWFVNSFKCSETGKEKRLRTPHRIPNPHQARYLHWLDKWRLEDLTVMVGLRVEKEGLVHRSSKSNRIPASHSSEGLIL